MENTGKLYIAINFCVDQLKYTNIYNNYLGCIYRTKSDK